MLKIEISNGDTFTISVNNVPLITSITSNTFSNSGLKEIGYIGIKNIESSIIAKSLFISGDIIFKTDNDITSWFSSCPTPLLTLKPTSNPTVFPSYVPTESPTAIPTKSPSDMPSSNPSNMPSSTPSTMPTSNPTIFPSYVPTKTPTEIPTKSPSKIPSQHLLQCLHHHHRFLWRRNRNSNRVIIRTNCTS